MADIATLGIEVRSESLLAASQNLDRFAGVTQRVEQRVKGFSTGMTTMQGSVNKLSGSLMNAGTVMTKFSNALQILGIGVAVNEIRQYADSWTLMSNKIAAASQSSSMQARSLSDLKKDADNARSSIVEYADLYARIMRNSKGVAKSEQEVADATNIVSKAFAVGGAAASEQAAGVLQLGQALGSGVLQGDELRSIRENAPVLAQAIADEFGTTISGLKNLGAQGQLTSDRVLTAILNARQKIEAQFSKTSLTIEQSLTLVKNAATEYVGTMDSLTGASRAVSGTIKLVADNFDFLGNTVLAAFGVSAARMFGPMIASAASATVEQVKLTAAVLEGNAVMLNSRTAALQKATASRETAVADQQAAKATLDAANAERVRAVQALDSARAGQLAGVTHAQAAAQVATASRAVSAAQVDLAAKTAIADRALLSEQVAMAGATRSARILGSVMSVASKAMTFVGGPIGAGLLAVGSALYYVSQQAQQAQERSDRYSEAIRRAGTDTEKAKDLIKNAGRELFNIDGINTQIEAVEKAKQAAQDFQKIKEQISGEILTYDIQINGNPLMPNRYEGLIADLRNLKKIAEDTKVPLSDLENAANQLGMQNPSMDGLNALLLKIIDLGKQARVAAGAMDSLNDKANSLDGQAFGPPVEGFLANQKMDEYVKKLNDFNALPKEERDKIKRAKAIKQKAAQDNIVLDDEHARKAAESELARDKRDAALKKSTHFSEREANAYRDLIKSGQDRIGQMELEAQVAGKAGIAADTLRMKLELEQKATDKGRVITAAKREEIDKLVVAYQKVAEASAKAHLNQDLSYQWRQMGRSDIDKSVADTLKQYGLEENLNSIDAANIRLLETTKRNQQAWQQLGDTAEDTIYRMIAGTDSWRDSLASLMPTIKDLVLQLAGLSDSKYSLGGMLSNAFGGGHGNPILMNKYGGMTGLFAKGSAFTSSGQVKMFAKGSAFTNSIVTSPTPFRFADGDGFGKGIMGEAGPEAVMPLKRDARGTLGIAVNGSGRSAPAQPQQEQRDVVVSVEASDYFDVRVREIAQQVSQQNIREYHKNLPNVIGQTINEAQTKNRM
ncbi:MAG: hypothetical protein [Bacteriophage sp.]|nr:MAG: hypothetical protein [Bacteriophage sp.]